MHRRHSTSLKTHFKQCCLILILINIDFFSSEMFNVFERRLGCRALAQFYSSHLFLQFNSCLNMKKCFLETAFLIMTLHSRLTHVVDLVLQIVSVFASVDLWINFTEDLLLNRRRLAVAVLMFRYTGWSSREAFFALA